MRISEIRLHPFGGIIDRSLKLKTGLNVIHGKNEAGKSTLVNAIRCALFQPTAQTASQFQRTMGTFIPLDAGDIIRVSIAFMVGDQKYRLEKSWGGAKSSKLLLPDGAEIAAPAKVDEMIGKLLVLSQGTYENILITSQSTLSETVDIIQDSPDATNSLADILRRSIFQTGGVCIDSLRSRVLALEEEYFSRWDRKTDGPEAGRGIANPWAKGIGKILSAYYQFRSAEEQQRRVNEYEHKADELARSASRLESEVSASKKFVSDNERIVGDVRKRNELSAQLQFVRRELQDLSAVQQQWPHLEEQTNQTAERVALLQEKQASLKLERQQAEEVDRQRSSRETFAKAKPLHDMLVSEEHKLATTQVIPEPDLKALKSAETSIRDIQIKLEAQKLSVTLRAKKPLSAILRLGGDPENRLELQRGEEYISEANGRITLEHESWSLRVSAGDEEIESLLNELDLARKTLNAHLTRLNVRTTEEAVVCHSAFIAQQSIIDQRRAALKGVLGAATFDELEKIVACFVQVQTVRPLKEINNDLVEVAAVLSKSNSELSSGRAQLDAWRKLYRDESSLLNMLVEKKANENDLVKQLSALKQLPSGVTNPEAFVNEFDRKKKQLEEHEKALFSLELDRKEFEKNQPEESREEIRAKCELCRHEFEIAKRHGEAYMLIRLEVDSLLSELDRSTFAPFQDQVVKTITRITNSRYTDVEMKETIPAHLNATGRSIPVDLLSVGTTDVLALALRLGMAGFYLNDRDGFLIMDDPLVNLDPDRQKSAADAIREFSDGKQVIVLTCQRNNADLLGGNIIEI